MVRKMAYIGFSWLLGLFFASFFSFDTVIKACAVLGAAILILLLIMKKRSVTAIICCIFFAVGSLYYCLFDKTEYQDTVKYNNLTVTVDGTIQDYTDHKGDMTSYLIKGRINGETTALIQCYGTAYECSAGDNITVKGIAITPKSDYSFDGLSYYRAKGIYLIVNYPDEITITPSKGMSLKRILDTYRNHIYDVMSDHLSMDEFAVVKAMLFGDKSGIDSDTKTALYRAGIGHMIAVSGTHLAIVSSLIWFTLCFLPIKKQIRFVILMVPILIFTVMAGGTSSVKRAAVMMILVYGAQLFDRRADIANSLGIAAILLTMGCPFAVRDPSLLLSFAGVIGISGIAAEVIKIIQERIQLNFLSKSVIMSVCATACVFPVSVLFFNEISVAAPVTNIVLVPLCTIILICGILTALTGVFAAYPLMKLCGVCCRVVTALSGMIGNFKLAYIPLGYDFIKFMVIGAAVIVILFALFSKTRKYTGVSAAVVSIICILTVAVYKFIPTEHRNVVFFTDGKGASAIVLHDKRYAAVIDLHNGGNTYKYIDKYFSSMGIERAELVIFSEGSDVSAAGLRKLVQKYDAAEALIPDEVLHYSASFADNTEIYDTNTITSIKMPDYEIKIGDDNTVHISCKGCDIFAYNGAERPLSTGDFDVAVNYKGNNPSRYVNGIIYINNDPNIEVSDNVYLGQFVKIDIYNGKFTAEVL